MKKRIPLGPDYHAEPGETKGHQHDVYTTKGELYGYTRIHVGTLMKSAVEDLAKSLAPPSHGTVTKGMVEAGRRVTSLSEGMLAEIYIAMRKATP